MKLKVVFNKTAEIIEVDRLILFPGDAGNILTSEIVERLENNAEYQAAVLAGKLEPSDYEWQNDPSNNRSRKMVKADA